MNDFTAPETSPAAEPAAANRPAPPRRWLSLARLTVMAWIAWLVALGAIAWLSYARVLHASCWYMAVPLAIQVLCTLAVLVGGGWRVAWGPRRGRALLCILFALLPTLWMAAYVEFLVAFASGRNHQPNWLTQWADAASSLVAEPYARWAYPYRYEGQRFVMWSDSPEVDAKQMAAMDAHLLAMEQALGERSKYKVYWVRGPVLGIEGLYVFGWALGSRSDTMADGADGLPYMDRHEAAHFAMDQLRTNSDQETPTLLIEGWAEANSGPHEVDYDFRLSWLAQRDGNWMPLEALVRPQEFHNSAGAIYWQGCVLVDYLLRRFGYAKCVELCNTCRQATFAADVQRVLGVSLAELDRDCRKDLAEHHSPDQRRLRSFRLAKGVDPQQWRQFCAAYCAGAARMRAQFCPASVTMTHTFERMNDGKTRIQDEVRYQYDCDGARRAIECQYLASHGDFAVTTPGLDFVVARKRPNQPWKLVVYAAGEEFRNRPRCAQGDWKFLDMPLLLVQGMAGDVAAPPTITEIQPAAANAGLVRISFASDVGDERRPVMVRGSWDFDPQRDYGLVEARSKSDNGAASRTAVTYETVDGKQVPKVARHEMLRADGTVIGVFTDRIDKCKFGPPPPAVFELATYGDFSASPLLHRQADLEPAANWLFWAATAATVLTLLLALGQWLVLVSRRSCV